MPIEATAADLPTAPTHSILASRRWTQFLVGGMIVLCFAIFWYGGAILGVPSQMRYEGSLLKQSTAARSLIALIGVTILLGGCAMLADAVLRRRWFMAGLAVACAGLTAWSDRGGPMHEVLFYAESSGIFFRMAMELVLLGAIVAVLWNFFWWRGTIASDALTAATASRSGKQQRKSEEKPSLAMALVAQCIAMAAIELLLVQTDAKKQALASVFVAGLAGTSVAESYFADRHTARWYWVGPVVVGVFGYLAVRLTAPNFSGGNRLIDDLTFSALARPLPLDYASGGMFGALMGYWMSQRDYEESN